MGMSGAGRLFTVELPLAFPTIFTGIRIAVVNAIGTAVFAAFVGGGGIGSVLTRGVRVQDMRLVMAGTGALMAIAAALDLLMGWFEAKVRQKRGRGRKIIAGAAILCAMFLAVLPLGLADSTGENELVLYDGSISESQLMHHMVKLLVEDKTDLNVVIKDQMSGVNNFKALTASPPTCDIMLSYDGTLLTTFLHLDPTDVPENMTLYDFANEKAEQQYGVHMMGKLGFDNTYAVAVPESIAERYSLRCVSDLVPVAGELTFGAEHEFFTQEGSMKYGPFTKFYGLSFRNAVSVDASLKYAAVESGSFEVTEVFATDGLNRKAGLRVLDDDLNFFPEYNGALVVRDDVFEKFSGAAPELESVLNSLVGMISNEDMVDMTYRVDVLGETVDDVALDFLKSRGLIG